MTLHAWPHSYPSPSSVSLDGLFSWWLLVWLWDQRQVSSNWPCYQGAHWFLGNGVPTFVCGMGRTFSSASSAALRVCAVLNRKEGNSRLNRLPIRHTVAVHAPELWVRCCLAVGACLLGFPWSWRGKLGTWLRKRMRDMWRMIGFCAWTQGWGKRRCTDNHTKGQRFHSSFIAPQRDGPFARTWKHKRVRQI